MAVSLISTGIQFPDNSIQTTAAGGGSGPLLYTRGSFSFLAGGAYPNTNYGGVTWSTNGVKFLEYSLIVSSYPAMNYQPVSNLAIADGTGLKQFNYSGGSYFYLYNPVQAVNTTISDPGIRLNSSFDSVVTLNGTVDTNSTSVPYIVFSAPGKAGYGYYTSTWDGNIRGLYLFLGDSSSPTGTVTVSYTIIGTGTTFSA